MSVLHKIAAFVLILSFITFVALFGRLPALRKTPIGWLQRALCLHMPNGLKVVDQSVTGGRITLKGRRLGHYLFYEKNPVVLVLFLFILSGSAALFLYHATQHLPAALLVPVPILLALPYTFTYLSVAYTGHHITSTTPHPHEYPFDHILFRPSKICSTCNIVKPARSKHCSLCRACIAESDHHCPWVNNCLGRGNYRWFLLLLLTLGMLEFYGAFLSWYILRPYLQTPPGQPFFSSQHFRDLGNAIVFAVNVGGLSIAGVGMLTASTACLPLGLLAYHCYLIWAGMTTNESQKWADWRDDMADGLVFVSSRSAVRAYLRKRQEDVHGGAATGMADFSAALGLTANAEDEPYVQWPLSSDQIVVRTNDGQAPRGQEGLWRRIWSLDEVQNIYDLGGWDNFVEVVRGH